MCRSLSPLYTAVIEFIPLLLNAVDGTGVPPLRGTLPRHGLHAVQKVDESDVAGCGRRQECSCEDDALPRSDGIEAHGKRGRTRYLIDRLYDRGGLAGRVICVARVCR